MTFSSMKLYYWESKDDFSLLNFGTIGTYQLDKVQSSFDSNASVAVYTEKISFVNDGI